MSSHYRSSSPGGRRIANPARLSDSYYGVNSYSSPRGSTERVIPISSTTFINPPRTSERLDTYATRPRRATLTEQTRPSSQHSQATHLHPTHAQHSHLHSQPRSRPAIVQAQNDRPASPLSRNSRSHAAAHNQEYYVTPAITSAPRREHAHKKVYSIDDGKSHLVADIDINPSRPTRRTSVDRNGYRSSTTAHTSAHRSAYHHTGPLAKRPDHVDIDSGFSYTDPAGMYRDTEPRRRPRAGSVEGSRNRPSSMILDSYPARTSARELGPPTSRALDRYNDTLGLGLNRGGSLRDPARLANPSYQDSPSAYSGSQEHHSSTPSKRHSAAVHQDRTSERREVYPPARDTVVLREPHEERNDRSRATRTYEDRSIERRGFGIRSESLDRRGNTRGSDENLDRREPYIDRGPGMAPTPDARDTASPRLTRDEARREQERRDYDYGKDLDRKEREKLRLRDLREPDRRDPDRRESDRREPPDRRDKDRMSDDQAYLAERDRDRARTARDSASYREHDRDRRDHDRYPAQTKDSGEGISAVLPAAAIGSLGAAAAYSAAEAAGTTRARDKERGHQSPPDSSREEDRSSRRHRDQRELRRHDDSPPARDHRLPSGDKDRAEKDRSASGPPSQPYIDPDEDYRRRLQQAQREIATVDPKNAYLEFTTQESGSDPEHRRRERSERSERSDRASHRDPDLHESSPPRNRRRSPDESNTHRSSTAPIERGDGAARDSRVRIVDPPTQKDEQQPIKSILRRPTEKFPEDPNPIREGVAPLKDATKDKSIPTDARWTKISRELVNPDCLEEAKERFEEREDCVIVLRVLTKEEIQKFADRTAEIRYARFEDADRADRSRRERRRRDKDHDRRERDEYSDHSEDEYASHPPRMLEAPSSEHDPPNDFVRDRRRDRDRGDREDGAYMSGSGGV